MPCIDDVCFFPAAPTNVFLLDVVFAVDLLLIVVPLLLLLYC